MLITAVVLLLELDKLVNVTLYWYGLVFSYDWAQPYWLLFRATIYSLFWQSFSYLSLSFPTLRFKKVLKRKLSSSSRVH